MLDQIKMVSLISLNGKVTKKVLFKQKYFIIHQKNDLFDSTFEHLNFTKAMKTLDVAIDPSWKKVLNNEFSAPYFLKLREFSNEV